MDHTDTRPTLMALVGLKDDYIPDGRVLTEIDDQPDRRTTQDHELPPVRHVLQATQLERRRDFGSDTLAADTRRSSPAVRRATAPMPRSRAQLSSARGPARRPGDHHQERALQRGVQWPVALPSSASNDLTQCNAIVADAAALLGNPGTGTPESPLADPAPRPGDRCGWRRGLLAATPARTPVDRFLILTGSTWWPRGIAPRLVGPAGVVVGRSPRSPGSPWSAHEVPAAPYRVRLTPC